MFDKVRVMQFAVFAMVALFAYSIDVYQRNDTTRRRDSTRC